MSILILFPMFLTGLVRQSDHAAFTSLASIPSYIFQHLKPKAIPISWTTTTKARSINPGQNRRKRLHVSTLSQILTATSLLPALSTKRSVMDKHA